MIIMLFRRKSENILDIDTKINVINIIGIKIFKNILKKIAKDFFKLLNPKMKISEGLTFSPLYNFKKIDIKPKDNGIKKILSNE